MRLKPELAAPRIERGNLQHEGSSPEAAIRDLDTAIAWTGVEGSTKGRLIAVGEGHFLRAVAWCVQADWIDAKFDVEAASRSTLGVVIPRDTRWRFRVRIQLRSVGVFAGCDGFVRRLMLHTMVRNVGADQSCEGDTGRCASSAPPSRSVRAWQNNDKSGRGDRPEGSMFRWAEDSERPPDAPAARICRCGACQPGEEPAAGRFLEARLRPSRSKRHRRQWLRADCPDRRRLLVLHPVRRCVSDPPPSGPRWRI